MHSILIIEDDIHIAELITLYLQNEGYRIVHLSSGLEGLNVARKAPFDLVILDRMLPEMEGLEVLKELRKTKAIPVLILSAKSDEIEKIIGLELGADDYLSKPFSPKELVARVKALLRRTRPSPFGEPQAARLHGEDLILDQEKWEVRQGKKIIHLSKIEFKILWALLSQAGRVFSREKLMELAYDHTQNMVFDRTIDAHIKNIRKKLKEDSKHPRYIRAVFGVGYQAIQPHDA